MEDRYLLDSFGGRTERKGRNPSKRRVLLVKKKMSNKVIKIYLSDVFSECLE